MENENRRGSLSPRTRLLMVSLILASTVIFVLGVAVERSGGESAENPTAHQETSAETPVTHVIATQPGGEGSETSGENGEGGDERQPTLVAPTAVSGEGSEPSATHLETSGEGQTTETSGTETVLGINIENPWLVGAVTLIWLLLAIALFRIGQRILLVIGLVAIGAAILDVVEIINQITRGNSLIEAVAIIVLVLHLAIALLSILIVTRRKPQIGSH
jgi:hypothetical protein